MSAPPDPATDREAIRDLVAAYAHAADRGRLDDLAALFAPHGVLELDGGPMLRGRAAIAAFLRDVAAARAAAADAGRLAHHVSSHRIVMDAPHAARGWAYFAVFTGRGPDHWGRYRDAYVRTEDGWRFAARHVRVDGRAAPRAGAPPA